MTTGNIILFMKIFPHFITVQYSANIIAVQIQLKYNISEIYRSIKRSGTMLEAYIADKIVSPALGIIEKGVVIVKDGKISEVKKLKDYKFTDKVKKYDYSKYNIYPGFVEAHAHITVSGEGVGEIGSDTNEYSDPITPHVKIVDAINPDTPEFEYTTSEGIVAAGIFPGSANLIGGLGAAIRTTKKTFIVDDIIIKDEIGLKMAFGENPKRVYSGQKKLYTRMGAMAYLRNFFNEVINYKNDKKRKPNIKYDIMLRLLDKEFPARIHAHQANDIQAAIRLSEEFKFDMVLEHGTETDLIVDFLKKKNIPVVFGPVSSPRRKIETRRRNLTTAGILSQNKIMTAISTDAPVCNINSLRWMAGLCIKEGMDYWDALKSLTSNSAKICRIDDNYGDIKPGMEPHMVVWDGDPLKDMLAKVIKIIE